MKYNNPEVSVIMSVYNGKKYLKEAIESILNQTFPNFEFIIVDDGSTDKTPKILKEYAKRDKRIKIITNSENIGLTKSLNKGIKLAKGKYIARMDADDVSLSERFERQIRLLEINKHLGCVGCNVLVINERGNLIKKIELPNTNLNSYLRKKNCFFHGSLMFSRKILEEVGNYNPEMELAQDYELLLRISKDYKIDFINKFLYKLRRNKNSISYKKFFSQVYYTAWAKTLNKEITSPLKRSILFGCDLFYSFFVIYKMGFPKIFRTLNLIS